MRRRGVVLALAIGLAGLAIAPGRAYLKFGVDVGGRVVTVRWSRSPIRYFVADRGVQGVSAGQLRDAVARAFDTWHGVDTAAVAFEFAGFTAGRPFDEDGMSTLGFEARPDLDSVLGATGFLLDVTSGEIVESDIFFNSSAPWSVAQAGEPGRFDVESIALHEIGHLLGLGHSALGETEPAGGGRRVLASAATMFPIAFSPGSLEGRTARADDRAGVSDLYPAQRGGAAGSMSGRVTRGGRGVFGAHVVAFNPETGRLVGNFSVNANGEFAIAGLDPGPHIVRVEPLDDVDPESFFEDVRAVDVDFRVTYLDRLVTVPRGGNVGSIVIEARPK